MNASPPPTWPPFLILRRSFPTRPAFTRTSEIFATDSPGPLTAATPTINASGPTFGWVLTIASNRTCSCGGYGQVMDVGENQHWRSELPSNKSRWWTSHHTLCGPKRRRIYSVQEVVFRCAGCLGSNCNETIRVIALDDTQALSVLLLSMLPGISGIKSPTMAGCLCRPVHLEVVVVVGFVESEIALKESIRPTIPFFGRFSVLLEQNSCGSIGRCERFGNADILHLWNLRSLPLA